MRAKPYIVVATFVLVLGACTSGSTSDRTPPAQVAAGSSPAADVLLLDTDAGPVAVSPSTGSILSGEAGAVAGPDGTRLYTTTVEGDHTTLVVRMRRPTISCRPRRSPAISPSAWPPTAGTPWR